MELPVLLVDVNEVARVLGMSVRNIWKLIKGGRFAPRAIKIGHLTRWNYAELHAWVSAGMPLGRDWSWSPDALTAEVIESLLKTTVKLSPRNTNRIPLPNQTTFLKEPVSG